MLRSSVERHGTGCVQLRFQNLRREHSRSCSSGSVRRRIPRSDTLRARIVAIRVDGVALREVSRHLGAGIARANH